MPKGLGLGLAVTRSLVELQGGRVAFDSKPGEGSTFRFTLPTTPPEETDLEPTAPSAAREVHEELPLASVQVLTIEDAAEIADMLMMFLETEGAQTTCAASAAEGLKLAQTVCPHVILLDMRLPDMDGYSVASELKECLATSGIPIIALTAQAMPQDRERCLAAGCADYVSKPVDFDRLRDAITKAIGRT